MRANAAPPEEHLLAREECRARLAEWDARGGAGGDAPSRAVVVTIMSWAASLSNEWRLPSAAAGKRDEVRFGETDDAADTCRRNRQGRPVIVMERFTGPESAVDQELAT